jgi:hypothetical protein
LLNRIPFELPIFTTETSIISFFYIVITKLIHWILFRQMYIRIGTWNKNGTRHIVLLKVPWFYTGQLPGISYANPVMLFQYLKFGLKNLCNK